MIITYVAEEFECLGGEDENARNAAQNSGTKLFSSYKKLMAKQTPVYESCYELKLVLK